MKIATTLFLKLFDVGGINHFLIKSASLQKLHCLSQYMATATNGFELWQQPTVTVLLSAAVYMC
jgi:hypothetical protein